MSKGINKTIHIGLLGQDPETKYTANGAAVTHISIATSESWKDKDTGQKQERTEWHRVVFFSRLAEIAGEYLRKGSKVYIEGSLRTNKWQDKDGNDRYTTEIIAAQMQMLDGRQEGSESRSQQRQDTREDSMREHGLTNGQQSAPPVQPSTSEPFCKVCNDKDPDCKACVIPF